MPVLSEETKNAILNGWLGPNRATGSPDEYQIEGFVDNPQNPGASQADFPGYIPNVWDSDDWEAADGGAIRTSSVVSLGTPTGGGTDAIRYWALRNTTSGALAFSAPLERPVYVGDAADSPVNIRPTVFHR